MIQALGPPLAISEAKSVALLEPIPILSQKAKLFPHLCPFEGHHLMVIASSDINCRAFEWVNSVEKLILYALGELHFFYLYWNEANDLWRDLLCA